MDIDLAGKTNNELEDIRSLVGEVCEFATEPDGIEFTAASIEVQRIKEDAEYEGVRSDSTGRSRRRESRCRSTLVLRT